MNLFELGLYLPGIDAVLDGKIPYRDFFHLRGPLEIYFPAFFMKILGANVAVLSTLFYGGTVITLLACLFIAKELLQSRLFLYLTIPVLIGRTFPRVTFTYWGGLRFAWGLLAVLSLLYYLRKKNNLWIFLSGVCSVLALFTSIEIGFCAITTIVLSFIFYFFLSRRKVRIFIKTFLLYCSGLAVIAIPYAGYLLATHSLAAYLNDTVTVITKMNEVIPIYLTNSYPQTLLQAIGAMNPFSRFFKYLTPAYCYLFWGILGIMAYKNKILKDSHFGIIALFVYGFLMYILAFRNLEANQWEMALQPEKILLFLLLETAVLFLMRKKQVPVLNKIPVTRQTQIHKRLIPVLLGLVILSSVIYSIQRYQHRFFAFKFIVAKLTGGDTGKIIPLGEEKTERLDLKKAKGFVVPADQADDLSALNRFIGQNTTPQEPVFVFPELGAISFLIDRPFIGKFPMVTFSWFRNEWHRTFFNDLRRIQPRFAIIAKDPGASFPEIYFKIPQNQINYDQIIDYIHKHYFLTAQTPSYWIYEINN